MVFVIVLPIVLPPLLKAGGEEDKVGAPKRVRSELDVYIVVGDARSPAPAGFKPPPTLRGFDVRYSVGVADGAKVRWVLAGERDERAALQAAGAVAEGASASPGAPSGTPPRRPGADGLLLLLVDGSPVAVGEPRGPSQSARRARRGGPLAEDREGGRRERRDDLRPATEPRTAAAHALARRGARVE